jgi:hypothetical protein
MAITIDHQTGEIKHSGSGTLKLTGNVSIEGKTISVVASLPSTPDANTIYFVTG